MINALPPIDETSSLVRRLKGILLRLQFLHALTHFFKAFVVWCVLACFIRGRMGWEIVHLIALAGFFIFFIMDLPRRRTALRRLEILRPDSDYRFTTLYEIHADAAPASSLEKLLRQIRALLDSPVPYLEIPGFAFSFRAFAVSACLTLGWSVYSPAVDQADLNLPAVLRVKPPSSPVRSGDDALIRIYTEGRMSLPVLQARLSDADRASAVPEEIPLTALSPGLYEATVRRATQGMTLTAVATLPSGGTVRSPDVRLRVLRAPILAVHSIWIVPPTYTGLAAEEKHAGVNRIEALPGTDLTVQIESDIPLASASSSSSSTPGHPFKVEWRDRQIDVKGTVLSPGTLTVTATSSDGLPANPVVAIHIDTVVDRAPTVSWLSPKQMTLDAPAEGFLPMRWQVDDDFGLSAFQVIVIPSSGEQKRLDVAFLREPRQAVSYLLEVTPFLSYAGSEVEVVAEASDNDAVFGPKRGRSPSIKIKSPTVMDVYKRLTEQGGEVSRMMERLSGESTRLLKKMTAAARTMKAEGKMAWQMEQELVSMAESAQEAKHEAEQALAELGRRTESAAKQSLLSRETLQKLASIGEMMSNLLKDQYVQAQRDLERSLGSVKLDDKQRALMSSKFNLEQFVDQIDRTHRMLERLSDIMAQSAAKKAMQDLVEQTNKALSDKSPDRLQSLSKNASSLIPKLQDLAKDPAFSDLKKALNSSSAELSKQFEQAAKAMRESGGRESASSKDAQDQLQKSLADLQSALDKGSEKSESSEMKNAAEKLGSVVDGLVFAIGEIESSYEYFLSARISRDPDEYSRHIQKSSAFEEILHSELMVVSSTAERMILFDPRPIQQLGRAIAGLHSISNQDEDPSAVAVQLNSAYRFTATAALELMELTQDLRKRSGTPKGRPMQDLSELLQQLISSQGSLNQNVQLSMQMGQFGQNLQQMAYQQELIRRSMEAESGRFSDLQEKLGRVDQVMEEMRKAEEELRQQGPTPGVQERQQKILNKLMELQQSLTEREEKDEKFEAQPFFGNPTETSVLNVDRPKIDEVEFLRGLPPEFRDIGRKYIRGLTGGPTPP